MKKSLPKIVIFGRTNVGKSTLFNCLTEKKQALVSEIEGTTRDSNISTVEWQGRRYELIDTGGIIDVGILNKKTLKSEEQEIDIKVQKQARDYLSQADLILFLVDTRVGLLPQDVQMSMFIKKNPELKTRTLLIANKADSQKLRHEIAVFNRLALGEPVPVSAVTGSGTGDLLDLIGKKIKTAKSKTEDEQKTINVAIIGKPNVGKSSLLNSILGYERVIVSPTPHTTREPQNTIIEYKNNLIKLIDTAGISKKGKKTEGLEKHGIEKSLAALKKADVALLVIDINEGLTHQDAKIIQEIIDRQISFAIIANKWDQVEKRDTKKFTEYVRVEFPFTPWAPIQFVSAKTGEKVNKVLDIALEVYEARAKEDIGGSQMNKFLHRIIKIHKPAKAKGTKAPRIYEIIFRSSNPPIFQIRIGTKDNIHDSYIRFIENRIREKFGFLGTPIKMEVIKNRAIHGKHQQFDDKNKDDHVTV